MPDGGRLALRVLMSLARAVALTSGLLASAALADSRRYGLVSFDRVEVVGDMIVEIIPGHRIGAVADASRASLETLSLEVNGRTLTIRQVAEGPYGPRRASDGPIRIRLATPALQQVLLRGAGQVRGAALRGRDIRIAVDGPGRVEANVAAGEAVQLRVVGSGQIVVGGRSRDLTAITNGAGGIDASMMPVRDLVVRASGSGLNQFSASATAQVTSTGAANVTVAGRARCEVRNLGAGTVTCGGASRTPLPTTADGG